MKSDVDMEAHLYCNSFFLVEVGGWMCKPVIKGMIQIFSTKSSKIRL